MTTTMTVSLARGRFGAPQPQIEIRLSADTNVRQLRAAAYQLAAQIEMATPAKEGWCVQMAGGSERAVVWLELMTGNLGEAARAMTFLESLLEE
jgi:hypothetical protein